MTAYTQGSLLVLFNLYNLYCITFVLLALISCATFFFSLGEDSATHFGVFCRTVGDRCRVLNSSIFRFLFQFHDINFAYRSR